MIKIPDMWLDEKVPNRQKFKRFLDKQRELGSDKTTSLGGTKGAAETTRVAAEKVAAHTNDEATGVTTLVL